MTVVSSVEGRESIVAKLARIANKIGEREPVQHSRDVKFPYHSAKDVYGWWREPLQEEGLLVVPTKVLDLTVQVVELPRSSGGTRKTFLTSCVILFTIYDGVTGELIEGVGIGQGEDPADKGAGKAMTYAEKNFLLGMGMNGSEPDVEAYDRERDDVRDQRRPDVVVTDSNIEGIQRGGRALNATDAQIAAVKAKAKELGLGIRDIAEYVYSATGIEVKLPEEAAEAGPALIAGLTMLTSEEIGQVIQDMDASTQGDERNEVIDDGSGYGG